MKHDFIINDYIPKWRHHNLIIQRSQTTQEFVNSVAPDHRYITRIDVENEDIKIITDAIEDNSGFGWTSMDLKASEIKEVQFKKYFAGNLFVPVLLVVIIILMMFFTIYLSKNYRVLYCIGLLGFIFYYILDDILEVMVIQTRKTAYNNSYK